MSGQNTEAIDANVVLGHILTKDSSLTIDDIKVMQHSLMDTEYADFSRVNGTFGPGTAAAVVDYLADNEHLISRLNDDIKTNLEFQGVDSAMFNALAVQPDRPEGEEVEYILAQSYALNMKDIATLNEALGGAKEGRPEYVFGPKFQDGLEKYIDANPSVVVQNTDLIEKVLKDSERFGNGSAGDFDAKVFREEVFVDSKGFMLALDDIVGRIDEDGQSAANYRAEMMLNLAGYRSGRADGYIDQKDVDAIKEFKEDLEVKSQSLSYSWKPETGFDESAEILPAAEENLVSALGVRLSS